MTFFVNHAQFHPMDWLKPCWHVQSFFGSQYLVEYVHCFVSNRAYVPPCPRASFPTALNARDSAEPWLVAVHFPASHRSWSHHHGADMKVIGYVSPQPGHVGNLEMSVMSMLISTSMQPALGI